MKVSKALENVFMFLIGVVVVTVIALAAVLYLYKGGKYLYTFTVKEIEEYSVKQEESLNKVLMADARQAYKTFQKAGISGVISLSKTKYTQLFDRKPNVEDLYRVTLVDMIGENIEDQFFQSMENIISTKDSEKSHNLDSLKNEYFKVDVMTERLTKVRNQIVDKDIPEDNELRLKLKKIMDLTEAELLGNDNQLNNSVAKNIITVTKLFCEDFTSSFGLNGLRRYSQLCFRELEIYNTISLQQLERCFVVDAFAFKYVLDNKIAKSSLTEYFSKESSYFRALGLFNKLGIAKDDAKKYMNAWIQEYVNQIKDLKSDDDNIF